MPAGRRTVLRRYVGLTSLFAGLLGVFACLTFLATSRPVEGAAVLIGGIGMTLLGIRVLARDPGDDPPDGP